MPEIPRRALRTVFLLVGLLYVASLAVQVYLAGQGVFEQRLTGDVADFGMHAVFGYTAVHGLALVMLVMSFFLKGGKAMPILNGAQFVVAFLMPPLATMGTASLAALHPVAAVVLVGLAVAITGRAWHLAPGPLGRAGSSHPMA